VRDVLDDVLPESVTAPGTELRYNRDSVPDHVAAVVDLLQDPDRVLTVGGTSVCAGDILGDTWDEFSEDVIRKVSSHVAFCDLIGARRALWYTGLSGAVDASAWFPNPWWERAVELLRRAAADNRSAELYYSPDHMADRSPPDDPFWERLLTSPAELTGPQCAWLQSTRIRDFLRTVRDEDRLRLGPLNDHDRFPGLAALVYLRNATIT